MLETASFLFAPDLKIFICSCQIHCHTIVVYELTDRLTSKTHCMKKGLLKKIFITGGSIFLLLVLVLCVHIYIVTRPKAPDAHTIVMTRIDIKQAINQDDAQKITTWLYQQNGIDHVLCNPESGIVVFTFYPIKTSADAIVSQFKTNFNYSSALRYVPSADELKGGCPVASTSLSYKTYAFIKKIF